MMDTTQSPQVRINQSAVALLTAVAFAIGLLPYVLFVELPWLIGIVAPIVFVLALVGLRSARTKATEEPAVTEMLLGTLGSVSLAATISFMGLVFWGTAWGGIRAVQWVHQRLSLPFDVTVSPRFPLWVSLPFVSLLLVATAVQSAPTLAKQLYPDTAGLRSAFYSMAKFQRGRALMYLLGMLATVLVTILLMMFAVDVTRTWWFALALAYVVLGIGLPLQSMGRPGSEPWSAIDAMQSVFAAAGYKVVRSPRTGREDIDPLLTNTPDLLVETSHQVFAVEVKARSRAGLGDWAEVDELLSAAWAIKKFLRESDEPSSIEVQPLLVLLGPEPAAMVRIYEHQENLRVLWIEDVKQVWKVQRTKDEAERRDRALRLLGTLATKSTLGVHR